MSTPSPLNPATTYTRAIQAMLAAAVATLDVTVPVTREGETAANPAIGYITWDWVTDLEVEQLSEDDVSKIWYPRFVITAWCSDESRRRVLEKCVLDKITPANENGVRRPFSGQYGDVWFHAIYHTGTSLIEVPKEGQTGAEVPGYAMSINTIGEVLTPAPTP